MGSILGVDVGGTFTDFIHVGEDGRIDIVKTPSTPSEPAQGVLDGLKKLAGSEMSLSEFLGGIDLIVHGTTITTNAVITRNYAKTGYITTKGFKDILNSRRGLKRNAFTAKEAPPKPIVPQYLVKTVGGRINKAGEEMLPLDEAEVRSAADFFREQHVETIAVNLMFSFLNPLHELRVKEILQEQLPDIYVSISSEVLPYVRMYERGSTTVFNACVRPLLGTYIDDLLGKLESSNFGGRLLTMQSNGGVMSPEVAKEFGANTLLSGPASGPAAALHFTNPHNLKNLITIDMGGTSLDACLIRDGRPTITKYSEVAEYALAVPSMDIRAIGSGGGSIAFVDTSGILHVGPESAGASPGPAAYGLGGEYPTVTDANILLGYLNPSYFLGGERKLYPDLSKSAISKFIAEPLGIKMEQAANGIIQLVNSQMANGVRKVSIEQGFDPRDAALVVAGGAGPLHACGIAEELGLDLIFIPKAGSVLCATGMLTTDLRHDLLRFASIFLDEETDCVEQLNSLRDELIPLGRDLLLEEKIPVERHRYEFAGDMLFEGQFNVLETPLPQLGEDNIKDTDVARLIERFRDHHKDVYGYTLDDSSVQIQSIRLTAIGTTEAPSFKSIDLGTSDITSAKKDQRKVWFDNSETIISVYDGDKLLAGNIVSGPSIIEVPTTTILIKNDWQLEVDKLGSYLLHPKSSSLSDTLEELLNKEN